MSPDFTQSANVYGRKHQNSVCAGSRCGCWPDRTRRLSGNPEHLADKAGGRELGWDMGKDLKSSKKWIKPQSKTIKCSLRPEQWELSRLREKECSSSRKHTGEQGACRARGGQTTAPSVRSLFPLVWDRLYLLLCCMCLAGLGADGDSPVSTSHLAPEIIDMCFWVWLLHRFRIFKLRLACLWTIFPAPRPFSEYFRTVVLNLDFK